MTFVNPSYLYLLLLLLPMAGWYVWRLRGAQADLQISTVRVVATTPRSYKHWLLHAPFVLRLLAVALVIVALARPQSANRARHSSANGIDIMLAIDVSSSMLAEDLKPNRLEAAKAVAIEFIEECPDDNIGLVVFAAESFLQCPLTLDHQALIGLFGGVKDGIVPDGTAIGQGLATSVGRLKDSPTKSKIVILLTDGSNNQGEISPMTAAEIARTFGIRVYTVGVGTRGLAPVPTLTFDGFIVYQNREVDIDEETLQAIAAQTGGKYYRATDNRTLKNIYHEISQLEKTKIKGQQYDRRQEEFHWFVLVALLLLLFEFILKNTVLRKLP